LFLNLLQLDVGKGNTIVVEIAADAVAVVVADAAAVADAGWSKYIINI